MDLQEIQHLPNAKLLFRLEVVNWMTNLIGDYADFFHNDDATRTNLKNIKNGAIPRVTKWQWFAERYEVEIWLYRTDSKDHGRLIDMNSLPSDIWDFNISTRSLRNNALGLANGILYKYIHHDIASMSLLTLFRIWLALGYTICLKNVPTYNIEPAHDLWLRP